MTYRAYKYYIICAGTKWKGGNVPNKKIGRPKIENPRTERLFLRITKSEKEEIFKKAEEKKMSVTEFILSAIKKVK